MDSFELGRLTDHDFEVVCRDLFEEILDAPLEIFPRGVDQGIDLRRMAPDGDSVVVQCKHWQKSGQAKLIEYMTSTELPKIKRLDPVRYILATSAELNVAGKDKLLENLAPYVRTTGDLYGMDQLVEELRKRPELVRRHFRLWLSGTAVLQAVLNQDVVLRSSWLRADIPRIAETFVPHAGFLKARDVLDRQRVCVITGVPGIGKTTVASMLAAWLAGNGYEVYEVSEDISEAANLWRDDVRQLFLYDDFLGQTTLERNLNKNEDNRLMSIIRRIKDSPGKALILTTRDYILEHARQRHGRLGEADLDTMTSVVRLTDMTSAIRAQIIYNHIYHSSIPSEEKRRFGEIEVWELLVEHRNFNPRLIERTLALHEPSERDFASAMLENLNDPRRIWEHIVEDELDDAAVQLLEALFNFRHASIADIGSAWSSYRRILGLSDDGRVFRRAFRILEGTMLAIENGRVDFHNPSIADYLRHHMNMGRTRLRALISSFVEPDQIIHLLAVATGHDGAGVLRQVRECRDSVEAAILDTADTIELSLSDEDYSPAAHLEWILEIAEVLDLHSLAQYVEGRTKGDHRDLGHYGALVSLAQSMSMSPMISLDHASDFTERVAKEIAYGIAELVEGDIWAPAVEEFHLLERLSVDELTWQARKSLIDYAVRNIRELSDNGVDRFDRNWARGMLDFVDEYDAYDRLPDEFDEMDRQLAQLSEPAPHERDPARLEKDSDWAAAVAQARQDAAWERAQIVMMMARLRES